MNSCSWRLSYGSFFLTFLASHCEPVISATALSLWVFIFCEFWLLHGELWYPLFPLWFNWCETFQRECFQVGGTGLWSNGLLPHHLFSCFIIRRYSYPLMEKLHNKHICALEHHTATHSLIKKHIPRINHLQCVHTDSICACSSNEYIL